MESSNEQVFLMHHKKKSSKTTAREGLKRVLKDSLRAVIIPRRIFNICDYTCSLLSRWVQHEIWGEKWFSTVLPFIQDESEFVNQSIIWLSSNVRSVAWAMSPIKKFDCQLAQEK